MQVLIRSLALFGTLVLAACDSGVMGPSLEDFKKVEAGMTRGEIQNLVGKPTTDTQSEKTDDRLREVWVTGNYKLAVDYEDNEAVNVVVSSLDGSGVPGEGDTEQSAEPASPDAPSDQMQQQPSDTP